MTCEFCGGVDDVQRVYVGKVLRWLCARCRERIAKVTK